MNKEYVDHIEMLHRHIIRDYILDFHEIYTKPVDSYSVDIDPYRLILDEYFTGVNDNIWLKLENRPKITKMVQKKLSNMMLELVLSTPANNIYSKVREDKLCEELNIDMRVGDSKFIIVKYSNKDITSSTRSKIIDILTKITHRFPMSQLCVGIIEGSYGSTHFDEKHNIYELRGDAFLKHIMPYKTPSNELNQILNEELAYCHYDSINSSLHMEAVERLSEMGVQNKQIVPPATKSAIKQYDDYVYGHSASDEYEMAKASRTKKKATPKKTVPPKKKTPKKPQKPVSHYSDSESETSEESSDDEINYIPLQYKTKSQQKKKKG